MPCRLAVAHRPTRLAILHGIADHQYLRVLRVTTFLFLLGMNDEFPEMAGKFHLLGVGDAGLFEAKHAILEPQAAQFLDVAGVIGLEIEAFDIGADVAFILHRAQSFFRQHFCLLLRPSSKATTILVARLTGIPIPIVKH